VVGLDGFAGSASAAAWAARHFDDAHFTAVHAVEHLPRSPPTTTVRPMRRCTSMRRNGRRS
jgi:hypothetical protein